MAKQDQPFLVDFFGPEERTRDQINDNFAWIWERIRKQSDDIDSLGVSGTGTTVVEETSDLVAGSGIEIGGGVISANIDGTTITFNSLQEMRVAGVAIGEVIIAPTATEVIDTVLLADYTTAKWILNINDSSTKSRSLEMLAREFSGSVCKSQWAITGEKMAYNVSVVSDGTNMTFSMTNNEANTITVKYRRTGI